MFSYGTVSSPCSPPPASIVTLQMQKKLLVALAAAVCLVAFIAVVVSKKPAQFSSTNSVAASAQQGASYSREPSGISSDSPSPRHGPEWDPGPRSIPKSVQAKFEAAFSIKSNDERMESLKDAYGSWCYEDSASAVRWAAENPGGVLDFNYQMELLRIGFVGWGDASPESAAAAARFAATLKVDDTRAHPIDAAVQVWAEKNPGDAKRFVEQLDDPALQARAAFGLVSALASTDPRAAAALSRRFGDKGEMDTNSAAVAQVWAEKDVSAAWRWASSLPDGDSRGTATAAIGLTYAQHDPDVAANWAASLPESENRGGAWSAVVLALSMQDSMKASDWIASLPASPDRDSASQSFIEGQGKAAPKQSAEVALGIFDPTLRASQLQQIIENWTKLDPVAANAWASAHRSK